MHNRTIVYHNSVTYVYYTMVRVICSRTAKKLQTYKLSPQHIDTRTAVSWEAHFNIYVCCALSVH